MLSRRGQAVLFSACTSDGPSLDSTRVSEDFVYATCSGSAAASLDRKPERRHARGAAALDYLNQHGSDCTREAALDLRSIRDVFLAAYPDGGNLHLLDPSCSTIAGSSRARGHAP